MHGFKVSPHFCITVHHAGFHTGFFAGGELYGTAKSNG